MNSVLRFFNVDRLARRIPGNRAESPKPDRVAPVQSLLLKRGGKRHGSVEWIWPSSAGSRLC